MTRKILAFAVALPLLAFALTACTSTNAADQAPPASSTPSADPSETGTGDWDVRVQPGGDLKAITYAPDAFALGQAKFEGTLTKNEQGCIGLESVGATALLAVSAQIPFEFIGEDQIRINDEVFVLGETVSVVGGNQEVGNDGLEACGHPSEVTLVSTIERF